MQKILPDDYDVVLKRPHKKQQAFVDSQALRNIIRAGRRSGKTVGISIREVKKFLAGKRILYATPTSDQLDRFWKEVCRALIQPIETRLLYKNESEHILEVPGTETRIRAKTAWNADTLRGDYADELVLDEWQLMDEDAWEAVGAPMMLDHNGTAIFIYTPPSLHSRSTSKARDPQHAAKMFFAAREEERAALAAGKVSRWRTFNFTSMDNPHLSQEALGDITKDMTAVAYRQEILAQDVDQAPGALWTREGLEAGRVLKAPDDMERVVVGVDPAATSTGDETGIVTKGIKGEDLYTLSDDSLQGSPLQWAKAAVTAYYKYKADHIIAESNQGGEMVSLTIATADPNVPVKLVHASRGKQPRAEPVSARAEKGHYHLVGSFPELEDELCLWTPGDDSPNRLDADVWASAELMGEESGWSQWAKTRLEAMRKERETVTNGS